MFKTMTTSNVKTALRNYCQFGYCASRCKYQTSASALLQYLNNISVTQCAPDGCRHRMISLSLCTFCGATRTRPAKCTRPRPINEYIAKNLSRGSRRALQGISSSIDGWVGGAIVTSEHQARDSRPRIPHDCSPYPLK